MKRIPLIGVCESEKRYPYRSHIHITYFVLGTPRARGLLSRGLLSRGILSQVFCRHPLLTSARHYKQAPKYGVSLFEKLARLVSYKIEPRDDS